MVKSEEFQYTRLEFLFISSHTHFLARVGERGVSSKERFSGRASCVVAKWSSCHNLSGQNVCEFFNVKKQSFSFNPCTKQQLCDHEWNNDNVGNDCKNASSAQQQVCKSTSTRSVRSVRREKSI